MASTRFFCALLACIAGLGLASATSPAIADTAVSAQRLHRRISQLRRSRHGRRDSSPSATPTTQTAIVTSPYVICPNIPSSGSSLTLYIVSPVPDNEDTYGYLSCFYDASYSEFCYYSAVDGQPVDATGDGPAASFCTGTAALSSSGQDKTNYYTYTECPSRTTDGQTLDGINDSYTGVSVGSSSPTLQCAYNDNNTECIYDLTTGLQTSGPTTCVAVVAATNPDEFVPPFPAT